MRTRLALGLSAAALVTGLGVGIPLAATATTTSTSATPATTQATAPVGTGSSDLNPDLATTDLTSTDPLDLLGDPTATTGGTCPDPAVAAAVQTYLASHPLAKAELAKLARLSPTARRAEVVSFLRAHPDVRGDVRSVLAPAVRTFVAAHPDVQGLVAAVEAVPVGQKLATAKAYVAAHPGVRADLVSLRQDLRACIAA